MIKKMSIILVIIGTMILIFGMYLALKSISPMYFNLIAGIIILIVTIFGLFGKQMQDKMSSEKSDKILNVGMSASDKITSLNCKIDDQAKTIDKLRNENTVLYSKLSDKTWDIYNNMTGGDSYCLISIININEKDIGYLGFKLGENNRYPLKKVTARIVDLNTFDKDELNMNYIFKNIIELGEIEPDRISVSDKKIQLDCNKGLNYNIFFTANNGFFTQTLKMRKVNGKWYSATIVTRDRDEKCIFKKIDMDYPEKDENKIFKE